MRIRWIIFGLLPVLAVGCAHTPSTRVHAGSQSFLLSFPNRLKPGEQVVRFELEVKGGTILAVNKVPYDWIINMLAEAPGSEMRGMPNHGASVFGDMAPLTRFLTVHKDHPWFNVTGSLVVSTISLA